MKNPHKKPKRRYHLSRTGRKALRASAQKNRPWEHSTGPRTFEGKLFSRTNNLKHGYYCRQPIFADTAAFRALMRSLRRQASTPAKPTIGPPVIMED